MHGLQYVDIAAQGYDHVGVFWVNIAVKLDHPGEGAFCCGGVGCEKGDLFEAHAGLVTLTG